MNAVVPVKNNDNVRRRQVKTWKPRGKRNVLTLDRHFYESSLFSV